jgi:hypothetical protein
VSEPFGPGQQRIGNQQREEAITALNDHFALARLDITEYQERVNRASGAQSYFELAELFRDLPQPHPPFLAPPSVPFAVPPPPPGYVPPPTQAYYPPPTGQQYAVPPPPPGIVPPGMGYPNPTAPYGYDPITGLPLSEKSKIAAGLLQIFLGNLGVGRFYTGHVGIGVAQLLTCGGCGIWSLVDGIIFLVNGGTDADGRQLRN